MNCKELIMSIVDADDQNGWAGKIDDARKLIAVAYYMGRESATKEVSDLYAAHIAEQHQRADACRHVPQHDAEQLRGKLHRPGRSCRSIKMV